MLLDEIEKAHPDVFNVLLQLMDDGRLTDGQGRTVDFTNTVLIMTSNLGGGADEAIVMTAVRDHFKPEFLNRIDEIVVFHRLDEAHIAQIVELQVEQLRERLAERGLGLELTDAARAHIARGRLRPRLRGPAAEAGDPARGRRPDRARRCSRASTTTATRSSSTPPPDGGLVFTKSEPATSSRSSDRLPDGRTSSGGAHRRVRRTSVAARSGRVDLAGASGVSYRLTARVPIR